mmetsp:Transcript_20635/g.52525  ORF Transcript_20635/g.52525 Transcript_20635/m.52525 type:complete len:176 (+) Transcript_20635:1152-1679(+)
MATRSTPYAATRSRIPALSEMEITESGVLDATATRKLVEVLFPPTTGMGVQSCPTERVAARPEEGIDAFRHTPEDIEQLILRCTAFERQERPSADAVVRGTEIAKHGYGWKRPIPDDLLAKLKSLQPWHAPGAKAEAAAKMASSSSAKTTFTSFWTRRTSRGTWFQRHHSHSQAD